MSAASLFAPPVSSPLTSASEWVTGMLLGSIAVSLCAVAIAFVGLRMMTGHMAVRDGLRVVVACFVLLGASAIASGLRVAASDLSPTSAAEPMQIEPFPPPAPRQVDDYDPYAGSSLRRD